MKYPALRQDILNLLKEKLPPNLYYHGVHHTIDVCNSVENIAAAEFVVGEELDLLRTAAVMHDAGFLEQYPLNEPLAAAMAARMLPQYGYQADQIGVIKAIILSTQIPQKPSTRLEKIMCDADLDYLGRPDFFEISESLKQEWLEYGVVRSEDEYNKKQIAFFEQHQYFTETSKANREPLKQVHLSRLKEMYRWVS